MPVVYKVHRDRWSHRYTRRTIQTHIRKHFDVLYAVVFKFTWNQTQYTVCIHAIAATEAQSTLPLEALDLSRGTGAGIARVYLSGTYDIFYSIVSITHVGLCLSLSNLLLFSSNVLRLRALVCTLSDKIYEHKTFERLLLYLYW